MKSMIRLMVMTLLCAMLAGATGCGTLLANQIVQRKNANAAAIRGVPLAGGGAGVGISLFDLGSIQSAGDVAIQLGGSLVDAAAVWAGYKLYERADASTTTTLAPTITTGNNSPVIISTGTGTVHQNNPYTPSTTTTTSTQ